MGMHENLKKVQNDITQAKSDITNLASSAVDGVYIPADALAADEWTKTIGVVPGLVNRIAIVSVIPDVNIGQDTDYMTLNVINKKADASGTTVIGTHNVDLAGKVDAFKSKNLITTSPTVNSPQVIALQKVKNGTGQKWPGGFVVINYAKV